MVFNLTLRPLNNINTTVSTSVCIVKKHFQSQLVLWTVSGYTPKRIRTVWNAGDFKNSRLSTVQRPRSGLMIKLNEYEGSIIKMLDDTTIGCLKVMFCHRLDTTINFLFYVKRLVSVFRIYYWSVYKDKEFFWLEVSLR